MQWIWTYPLWTLFLVALVAAAITIGLYWKTNRSYQLHKFWIIGLASLRWLSLFLLGLLLLNPLLKYISHQEITPLIIFLEDQTASVAAGMQAEDLQQLDESWEKVVSELSKKYDIARYPFGTGIVDSARQYAEMGTDIDLAMTQAAQRNIGKHIGAVILSSDGIYNHGLSPVYNTSFAGIPFYTIALGDTATQKDVWIQRVSYNDLVYLDDEVQLVVDVVSENYLNQKVNVSLKNEKGQVLSQKALDITSSEWMQSVEFVFTAEREGMSRYQVEVSRLSSEKTYTNNVQSFYIEVIDGRQKIVLLYDAPHSDIKLIKDVLVSSRNIDVEVLHIEDFEQSSQKIDLLILHGLPSLKNTRAHHKVREISQKSEAVWWIVSSQTNLSVLNQHQDLVRFSNVHSSPNDVRPVFEESYQKFFVSEDALNWLSEVPPLLSPYGEFQLSAQAEVCWSQKLGQVHTSMPLLVTAKSGNQSQALLLGEGLWRWALLEYALHENQSRSYEWIERLTQYVANKSDHRQFRLRTYKSIYNESEAIGIEAALYNENAQLTNTPEVQVRLKNDAIMDEIFMMDKTQQAYSYHLGKLPAGSYTLQAEVELGNQKHRAESRFAVQSFDLETSQTKADYQLLNTLARNHQSEMVHFSQVEKITELINQDERIKPTLKEVSLTQSIIEFKVILAAIIFLLSLEWFLRRFLGQY